MIGVIHRKDDCFGFDEHLHLHTIVGNNEHLYLNLHIIEGKRELIVSLTLYDVYV
jgi:hypothetical protein